MKIKEGGKDALKREGKEGKGEGREGEGSDHKSSVPVGLGHLIFLQTWIPHLSGCLALILLSLLLSHDLSTLECKLFYQVLLEGPLRGKSRVLDFGRLCTASGLPFLLQVLLHLFDDLVLLFQRHALTLGGGTLFRHGGCVQNRAACSRMERSSSTQTIFECKGRVNG